MTMPPDFGSWEPPKPPGVRELNLGDLWRARWVEGGPLPRGVPVDRLYGVVLLDSKGYVSRARGAEHWDTLEGVPAAGEPPAAFLKKLARDHVGADATVIELIGYLDCRATSHNPTAPAGTAAVRAFYTMAARKVAANPGDPAFERRRLPLNEFMQALRLRYPEFEEYFGKSVERYVILHAKNEAP